MKKMALVAMLLSVLVVAGCGGSRSTDCTAGYTAAENSFDDFDALLDDDNVSPCMSGEATTCNCPGGGTMTGDSEALTASFYSCISATGKEYNGYLAATTTLSGTMDPFGDCTSVTVSDVPLDGCGGIIKATCGGLMLHCDISDDGAGGCDLNCTC